MVQTGRNELCWCGSGRKYKKCHGGVDAPEPVAPVAAPGPPARAVLAGNVSVRRPVPDGIARPEYAESGKPARPRGRLQQNAAQLEAMRETCRLAARVLQETLAAVDPGVTTDQLDALAHERIIAAGAYPSPLNYMGFPKSICTSVNEVICHGIPDDRPLQDGDIVNVDVTVFFRGVHGDCSATVPVGRIDSLSRHLLETARACLDRGIAVVRPGALIRDIGRAIEPFAKSRGCSVVRAYCGHGIGANFHTDVVVPHHDDRESVAVMRPGMTFTIEPMLNLGGWRHRMWNDGWTAVTADGQRSAQFEHTVLVTKDGVEVLTECQGQGA